MSRRPSDMDLVDVVQWYIENRVAVDDETGCWEMPDVHKNFLGYPRISFGDRPERANRLFYAALVGDIPDGLFVLHTCDNPGCVNPDHLWLGTQADNMRDKCVKGRHGCAVLTEEDVREIRRLRWDLGMTYDSIADAFEISTTHARKIANGESWAHLV